jgi:zinc protease
MKPVLLSCVLLALLSGTTPAFSEAAPGPTPIPPVEQGKVFNAETFTLANGMDVVVISNHRAPVVTHMVWYKAGAADEPQGDGVSGTAHFLEHLMFKGSNVIEPGEFSKLVRGLGGEDNAFTSLDYTAYFQSISKDYLPTVMALEADRMVNITLMQKEIESELKVIQEERRQRTDNKPQALFAEQIRAALFNTSPYSIPILGWRDEIPKLTRPALLDYYKTWYAPNNAILIVSGDITAAELKPLAEKFYGVLEARPVPNHIRPELPDFPAAQTLTMRHNDVRQPVLIRAWRAPGFLQDRTSAYALQVLEEVISGGPSTPLYQSIVVKQKLATSINLSYDGNNRGSGSLWIYATPAPGVSLEKLQAAIEKEFRDYIGNGFAEDDVTRAKTRLISSAIYARDSVSGPAMIVGQALASGASLDDVEYWPQYIDQVKEDDVLAALKTYLSPDEPRHQPVTGYLLPQEPVQ